MEEIPKTHTYATCNLNNFPYLAALERFEDYVLKYEWVGNKKYQSNLETMLYGNMYVFVEKCYKTVMQQIYVTCLACHPNKWANQTFSIHFCIVHRPSIYLRRPQITHSHLI